MYQPPSPNSLIWGPKKDKEKGNMSFANQPNTPLLSSSSHAGTGIYAKRETIITRSDNNTPIASPPAERGNSHDNGGSSHVITVMSGPRIIVNNNNNNTFHRSITGDSQVHHLRRPKAFRQLSNSSSLLSEIFRHPDTSEDLLRKKINGANELDASGDLIDFLRNKTPPPENYMSSSEQLKGGKPLAKKKGGVFSFLGRKFRRGKKAGQTSSAPSPAPPIRLPDSAISGRTIGGHRHIAISIPLEHANINGIVDDPKPLDKPVPDEPLPAEQPQPKDTKERPIAIRRKSLNKTQVRPVVGVRSSSAEAATATARIVPPSPHKAPPPTLDPDETIVVLPTSPPGIAATQHCGDGKGDTGGLPAAAGGRSLVDCPHRELTAPRVSVSGGVVPLMEVFSPPPPPPRPLHRSPPLRQLYRMSNARSEDAISKSVTSSTTTYNSEAEPYTSSTGATVRHSVIPELKSQQNTIANAQGIGVPAQKRPYRDWAGTAQLPTPPGEQEEALSEAEAEENDRFVTAQASFERNNEAPWATPFEEGPFLGVSPYDSSTPKLRPLLSTPPDASSASHGNKVSEHRTKERRRIPRSESHIKLMEKYQRLQMLRARELEILLGRVKALEGRQEVGARRGHVTVHALEPEHYTTAAKPISGGMAVLCGHDGSYDGAQENACGGYEELSSVALMETSSEDGDEVSTAFPGNLDSDYEESLSSFHPSPSSNGDNNRGRASATYPPSLDALSDTNTFGKRRSYTTPKHTRNDDRPPSHRRCGFPHPPTVFPATNTMYSVPMPTARPNDSFKRSFERMDKANRKALARAARRSANHNQEDEYDYGLGDLGSHGGGDGLETVEPVVRWLIGTSGAGAGGSGVSGSGGE